MTNEQEKKTKTVKLRLSESLKQALQLRAQTEKVFINDVLNSLLTASLKKKDVIFQETIGKQEKREVEVRVYFTVSEADILRAFALLNDWSLGKEIRYRVISTFAKKPKLSGEEMKAIYAVRSSINVLGANVNRLVRDRDFLSDRNISVCQDLIALMQELKDKIRYLEKCRSSTFKLKTTGDGE